MNKKHPFIVLLCLIAAITAGTLSLSARSLGFHTGPVIAANNGSYLIVIDRSPVVMHPHIAKDKPFQNIDTGDSIFIIHDGIAESYPGQTGLYFMLKLSDGSISDIPSDVIAQLRELGWLE